MTVRDFNQFTPTEIDGAAGLLSKHGVGAGLLKRLGIAADGAFVFGVRSPTLTDRQLLSDDPREWSPWSMSGGEPLKFTTAWVSIEVGIKTIADATSPDSIVQGRLDKYEAWKAGEEVKAATERKAIAEREREQQERLAIAEKAKRDFDFESWERLPEWSKALYIAALSAESAVAIALKRAASLGSVNNISFPGRAWK